jgi:glycosyltransferase involved in cell wall biosynthesis
MKRFPKIGMRPIARTIRNWWRSIELETEFGLETGTRPGHIPRPAAPESALAAVSVSARASTTLSMTPRAFRRALLMTYPHYLYLWEQAQPDVSVYYNLDDYALYWPGAADSVRSLEREMVRRTDLTICVARARAESLREMAPEAAGKILHIPHGAPSSFLAESPLESPAEPPVDDALAGLPRPWLGYVGSLEDRLDWLLLERIASRFPRASLVLVGRRPEPNSQATDDWMAAYTRLLARPNVHAIGWRSQETLPRYFQTFDINLIPYRLDHPFNRVCCPTKIMDAMGATRPVVATAIPECRLHTEHFHVADDHEDFELAVRGILEAGSNDGRAAGRLAFARSHSCRIVANEILARIASLPTTFDETNPPR